MKKRPGVVLIPTLRNVYHMIHIIIYNLCTYSKYWYSNVIFQQTKIENNTKFKNTTYKPILIFR